MQKQEKEENKMKKFTHFDSRGNAVMIDVSERAGNFIGTAVNSDERYF